MADPVQEAERVHQGRNKWGKMDPRSTTFA